MKVFSFRFRPLFLSRNLAPIFKKAVELEALNGRRAFTGPTMSRSIGS